jgi:nucleotide-binding universal stress UspA family protein
VPRVRRVIVGASGSPGSIRALRHAHDLACQDDALLIPVIAWTPPGGDLAERRAPSAELRRAWAAAATQRLQDALQAAWGGAAPAGLTVRPCVVRGEPGAALVDEACYADDLLVVGAGRRGALGRLRGGRVSRYCLAHATCPVLAVPPPALAQESGRGRGRWAFRHRQLTMDQVLREWDSSAA